MSSTNESKSILHAEPVGVDKDLKDLSKDPYFVKMHEEAWEFLKKAGIPEDLKKKKK